MQESILNRTSDDLVAAGLSSLIRAGQTNLDDSVAADFSSLIRAGWTNLEESLLVWVGEIGRAHV